MLLSDLAYILVGGSFLLLVGFALYIRHKRVLLEMEYVDSNWDGMTILEESERIIEENQTVLDELDRRYGYEHYEDITKAFR